MSRLADLRPHQQASPPALDPGTRPAAGFRRRSSEDPPLGIAKGHASRRRDSLPHHRLGLLSPTIPAWRTGNFARRGEIRYLSAKREATAVD